MLYIHMESDFLQELELNERESWINFHRLVYKEDLEHANANLLKFPRWSIISAYYAMHDIAKLYIGKIHNRRVTGERIHKKVIEALKFLVKNQEQREKIIKLLQDAEITFFDSLRLKEDVLPLMLRKGRQERGKAQYYSSDPKLSEINSQKAAYFIDNIVKPFIQIMEAML